MLSTPPNTIMLEQKWHIGSELDSGGFASVFAASDNDGHKAAAKFIPKASGAQRELLFEDLIDSTNVVPILDSGEWEDYWVLVMPMADKSLRTFLSENAGQLTLDDSVSVLIDITEALVSLEDRVVHRDIKPENILLLEGKWCIADFGISRYAEATTGDETRKFSMSPPYAAPEQWRQERASSSSDIYALGVVAYELLAGQRPFPGPEVSDYREQHLEGEPPPIPGIPARIVSIINECLYKASEARPRPKNLLARLTQLREPSSDAAQRLQLANAAVVEKRAEAARQESIARTAKERRQELYDAAAKSLARIKEMLDEQIRANAPTTASAGSAPASGWSLGSAELRIDEFSANQEPGYIEPGLPQLDVIAYSVVSLRRFSSNGHMAEVSHSLWFFFNQDSESYRWHEIGFRPNPLAGMRMSGERALPPGQDALLAISNIISEYEVAFSMIPIDQGYENEFIERWMGSFAGAANA